MLGAQILSGHVEILDFDFKLRTKSSCMLEFGVIGLLIPLWDLIFELSLITPRSCCVCSAAEVSKDQDCSTAFLWFDSVLSTYAKLYSWLELSDLTVWFQVPISSISYFLVSVTLLFCLQIWRWWRLLSVEDRFSICP